MFSRRSLAKSSFALPVAYALLNGSTAFGDVYDGDCGVASGDPRASSVTIWTRVPLAYRVGLSRGISVKWEVATDDSFGASVVASGAIETGSDEDYTLRAMVEGLSPFTTYYYRFKTEGGYLSVTGRTKTAPERGNGPRELKIAAVSCQKISQGYYTAFLHLARENVDFVLHLGDHIYENEKGRDGLGDPLQREASSLDDYRKKYRYYLSDPAYREVRRLFAAIDIWDDHEVKNDYAGAVDRAADPSRYAGAYQAFLEFMPVSPPLRRDDAGVPTVDMFASFAFGDLLDIVTMDQRQYRVPTCPVKFLSRGCDKLQDPATTMLGTAQKAWVQERLGASKAQWKLVMNQVMMAPMRLSIGFESSGRDVEAAARSLWGDDAREMQAGMWLNLDAWDGYPLERRDILEFVERERIANTVMVTGDIHAAADAYLYSDPSQTSGNAAALEIVTTSITSNTLMDSLRTTLGGAAQGLVTRSNPHLAWNSIKEHGYTVLTIDQEKMAVRHMMVDTIATPTANLGVAHATEIRSGSGKFS